MTANTSKMIPSQQRTLTATVCGIVVIAFLAMTVHTTGARAQHADQEEIPSADGRAISGRGFKCNNATLEGRYTLRGDGFVPAGPGVPPTLPFAIVSLMTLDGSGNLSNDVTVSRNGEITRSVDSGTYTVNQDCTGNMTINISTPPFQLNFDLVVAAAGDEFELIATTPSVVTIGAKRLR